MHVFLNEEEGELGVRETVVAFTPSSAPDSVTTWSAHDVSQLMRSRKDETTAKVVASGANYIIKFSSLSERESFIESVVKAQETDVSGTPSEWITSTICSAAVDEGVLTEGELKEIVRHGCQRGVLQPFDALETLVDPVTLRLRPLTEQMENDILRQIPVLAVIFQRRVMDEDTRRNFWEAVVRKYFCFSRTFLEEDLQDVQADALAPAAETSDKPGLPAINAASWRALPKRTSTAYLSGNGTGDDQLGLLAEGSQCGQVPHRLHECYFFARRPMPPTSSCASSRPVVAALRSQSSPIPLFYGHPVTTVLPKEATSREALEILRQFWRCEVKQREAVLKRYPRKGKTSLLQDTCYEYARRATQK